MSGKHKISIITVVFNGEKHLEEAIKSVFSQDTSDFEYIIIDGNSTDKTFDIINKYKDRIDIIISEPDNGLYDAMNKGINLASGEYIYFLNSDDYLFDKNVLTDFFECCKKETKDIIIGKIDVLYESPEYSKEENIQFNAHNLKRGIQPPHSGSFFTKKSLKELRLFDIKYKSAADFDLFCKALKNNYKHAFFDRKIAVFRDGGISAVSNKGRMEGAKIIKVYFGYFWYLRFYVLEKVKNSIKRFTKLLGIYPYLLKFHKTNKF